MNPDQMFLKAFLAGDGRPAPFVANPLAAALNAELLAADSAGTVTLAFEPGPQFLQGAQVLQGGVVATMLDFALAFAALVRLPEGGAFGTVNLNVSMMKPALAGRYQATGKVVRMGKTMIFGSAELRRGAEDLVATAAGVMAIARA
ncbi:MAG: PaaI family thioesterase [Alphaproteobacteria bacterium]|nr:PaaI family thioesterase [Alphaproteobacteria bacterium]MDE2013389.1 PaaI family thioesterase [Alphaproteobacteria bacterium]MDE2075097.1 PaaI family thioesterase [Alphaproteobacteria bacterium]MDE2350909.1 PaaI family thioesterase [Alphaproteobacteria bacterium]